jgi:hypothetical protein
MLLVQMPLQKLYGESDCTKATRSDVLGHKLLGQMSLEQKLRE